MGFLKRVVRRGAAALRHAGGFAGAEEGAALTRDAKKSAAHIKRLEARLDAMHAQNAELRDTLARLEKAARSGASAAALERFATAIAAANKDLYRELKALGRRHHEERHRFDRMESQLAALLKALHLRADELPYPWRLMVRRFGVLSQHGEDGITTAILSEIGPGDRRFVEIGCADRGWNTGFLAEEAGWRGLMIDHNEQSLAATRARFAAGTVRTVASLVTPGTLDALICSHGFEGEFDLLSIDVDGNDYWLWESLTAAQPRLVIVEYNPVFGAGRAVVVPYASAPAWSGSPASEYRYFGASLTAMERLGARKGYRLVAIEADSANAYFLRNDAGPHIPAADVREVFRPQRKYVGPELRAENDIFSLLADRGLPLVDVAENRP